MWFVLWPYCSTDNINDSIMSQTANITVILIEINGIIMQQVNKHLKRCIIET